MHILPYLEEHLPDDLVWKLINQHINKDVYCCFTCTANTANTNAIVFNLNQSRAWYHVMRSYIREAAPKSRSRSDRGGHSLGHPLEWKIIDFLIKRSLIWKLQEKAPLLLESLVKESIRYNNIEIIRVLLDNHPFLCEFPFSHRLFSKAIKQKQSHLLRMFALFWKFELSQSFLQKCIIWMQKTPERVKQYSDCERECKLLVS
jgi:hypothetical protein